MASTYSTALNITSSSGLVEVKAPRQSSVASPQCVSLPTLPPPPVYSPKTPWKATAYFRKIARNVMAMGTGEATPDVAATELPEVVKTVQEAWEKVEDKYAVSTLGVAVCGCTVGLCWIDFTIDRLPVVPGALECCGSARVDHKFTL